jgi:hypothetical protein
MLLKHTLAITGIVTAAWISLIMDGSLILATPPSARISAGIRSSAMTATAPAASAIYVRGECIRMSKAKGV